MPVSQKAVRDFLNRELNNSDKVKRFTEGALDRKLAKYGNPLKGISPPRWVHQKACFLLGLKYPRYLLLLDMGLGKTWVMLALFNYRRRRGLVSRMLVLVPNTTNVQQWVDEVEKYQLGVKVVGLDVAGEDARMGLLHSNAEIVVITYAGWMRLTTGDQQVIDKKTREPKKTAKGNKKHKWVIDKRRTQQALADFDMAVFDECSLLGNHTGLPHRVCRQVAKRCRVRYGLTGTPFGRNPEPMWGQFFVVDNGETLGETIDIYRGAFFTSELNYWSGWPEYKFDERKKRKLYEVIRHRSVRYSEDECADLPKRVPLHMPVILPKGTWAYYAKLVEELKAAKGNYKMVDNAFHRMRQICSGYLVVKGEDGEKTQITFEHNPKLQVVLDWVEQCPAKRKIILFHIYRRTGQLICDGLKARKIKHVWLYGGTSNKKVVVHKFLHNPKVRVMVSSSAGALGGNWQVANYTGFYESPTDPKTRKQMIKRTHRGDQRRTCFIADFPVKGSIEDRILKYVNKGIDFHEAVVDGKALVN